MTQRTRRNLDLPRLPAGLLLALVPWVAGCTLTLESIRLERELDFEAYEEIEVGRDTLGDVLAKLGPPDSVEYTLPDEVLEYRHGYFWGPDFSAQAFFQSFPGLSQITTAAGVFQRIFEFTSVDPVDPPVFSDRDPVSMLIPLAVRLLASNFNLTGSFSSHRVFDMSNRQIRHDIMQIVLDRETGIVKRKGLLRDATAADRSWFATTFLQQ